MVQLGKRPHFRKKKELSLQNSSSDIIMTAAKLCMKDRKMRNHFDVVHKL